MVTWGRSVKGFWLLVCCRCERKAPFLYLQEKYYSEPGDFFKWLKVVLCPSIELFALLQSLRSETRMNCLSQTTFAYLSFGFHPISLYLWSVKLTWLILPFWNDATHALQLTDLKAEEQVPCPSAKAYSHPSQIHILSFENTNTHFLHIVAMFWLGTAATYISCSCSTFSCRCLEVPWVVGSSIFSVTNNSDIACFK